MSAEIDYKTQLWLKYEHEKELRDLVERLLCKDPRKRISARQALLHPVFNSLCDNYTQRVTLEKIRMKIHVKNEKSKSINLIKKGVLHLIIHRLLNSK